MICRQQINGATRSKAVYSDCQTYRYLLSRRWAEGPRLLYILLNPSTATEERNDPTIERCERRARALGYGGFAVANLFALRATDPRALYTAADPVGPGNDALLLVVATKNATVLCGWGTHGALGSQVEHMRARLVAAGVALSHLGLTRMGHPRHPLYVSYQVAVMGWPAANRENS